MTLSFRFRLLKGKSKRDIGNIGEGKYLILKIKMVFHIRKRVKYVLKKGNYTKVLVFGSI